MPSTDSRPTSAPPHSAPGGSAPGVPAARRGPGVSGLLTAVRAALRHAAPALLAYAAVRLTGLAVLALWAHRRHHGVWSALAAQWDADWYLGIADHGYTRHLGTAFDANNLAFFPLYPVLVKAVAVLTPARAPRPGWRSRSCPRSSPRGASTRWAVTCTAVAWACC
ncbi:hypothetical protein [Streptomyces sp. LN245]|uniref:hypothetical protein n=1 Tax=Streptomyces sp. LN245 TaxID=3112975 RepID=UPI003723AB2E